jgi:hypothetical protein
MARAFGKKGVVPPDGKIRQSQVVTTFGPGAMVDLVDDAVLIGGLDFWSYGGSGNKAIHEPRLRDRVAEMLRNREANVELNRDRAFRPPPEGDDSAADRRRGVTAFEFPHWFVCQRCRALVRKDQLDYKGGRYRHACIGKSNGDAVPVRFVAACRRGHLSDFPWIEFVHERRDRCSMPQLFLHEGSSGDFSEVQVKCEVCGHFRKLSEAKVDKALPFCRGERPWLGPEGREECSGEHLRLIVRTASNGYFPQVVSALTIPEPGGELRAKVDSVRQFLSDAEREDLPVLRKNRHVKAALGDATDDEVWQALQSLRGKGGSGQELRTAEWTRFLSEPAEESGERPPADAEFFARAARGLKLPPQIERIVLAQKLREVRVQIGFTRLESSTANLQGEFDLGVQTADLALTEDWLPATEVNGEGLLLVLDEAQVAAWEERDAVRKREDLLRAGYERWRHDHDNAPPFPGARFYMLHTLAHMLITAVSLDCGYAASAIRERIYCSPVGAERKMAGILLSTGTSGGEGTLGGLVEQGRRIGEHLASAWDLATLCSNDPVCAHHEPEGDYAERYLEGAACHGCLFIAECSCERFNRYLDRALVVPVIGEDHATAFFVERPSA